MGKRQDFNTPPNVRTVIVCCMTKLRLAGYGGKAYHCRH
jgi:hypothetical protein